MIGCESCVPSRSLWCALFPICIPKCSISLWKVYDVHVFMCLISTCAFPLSFIIIIIIILVDTCHASNFLWCDWFIYVSLFLYACALVPIVTRTSHHNFTVILRWFHLDTPLPTYILINMFHVLTFCDDQNLATYLYPIMFFADR